MSITLFARNSRVAPAIPATRSEMAAVLADPAEIREFFAVESMIDGTTTKFLNEYGRVCAA